MLLRILPSQWSSPGAAKNDTTIYPVIRKSRRAAPSRGGVVLTANHLAHQVIEGDLRILADAGVHRRQLDDRAAGRDQPVEPDARRHRADDPRRWATVTDDRHQLQVLVDERDIRVGCERPQPLAIQLHSRLQKVLRRAGHDHTGVDELLSINPRHHADDRGRAGYDPAG